MKYQTLSLALAALLALTPAYAQSSRGSRGAAKGAAAAAEAEAPKTGVRFVICAPDGGKLPSPLFYQAGKDKFKKATISGRIPTQRIKPSAGVIHFYDTDPGAVATDDAGKKNAKAAAKELPKPVMTINVPANAGSKCLCIVIPGDKPQNAKTFFLNEEQFPSKGVHLINLSPQSVRVYTSKKGDFSEKEKEDVGPYRKESGVDGSNSWHYTKGNHGDQISFRITTKQTQQPAGGAKKAAEATVRMGKFLVSDKQGQVNIVVKDGKRNGLKLMSVQMAND